MAQIWFVINLRGINIGSHVSLLLFENQYWKNYSQNSFLSYIALLENSWISFIHIMSFDVKFILQMKHLEPWCTVHTVTIAKQKSPQNFFSREINCSTAVDFRGCILYIFWLLVLKGAGRGKNFFWKMFH